MSHASIPYLARDVSRDISLLTAEEEAAIGRTIQSPDSTPEEREQAVRTLCDRNVRLVINIARRGLCPHEDLGDVVSDGTLGLIRAAQKFDPMRGFRFTTYATFWIRQAISRGRAASGLGRPWVLPYHALGHANRARQFQREREAAGETISLEEAGRRLGLPAAGHLWKCDSLAFQAPGVDAEHAYHGVVTDNHELLSLDNTPAPEIDVEAEADRPDLTRIARDLIRRLPAAEKRVIRLRHRIDPMPGGESPTLEAIGKLLGVTGERVRQIQVAATTKLRRWAEEAGCS